MPKTRPDFEKKIARAALQLASSRGWKNVTVGQIAKAAKVPSSSITFTATNGILPVIIRFITAESIAAAGKPDPHAPPRDRIFEVMMARFDVLQKYRKAIENIMAEMRHEPAMLCAILPEQGKAMQAMLNHAGLGQTQCRKAAAVGLQAVFLAVLRVWRGDETVDMAKTMAALDRYLRWASPLAEILFHERL